MNEINPVLADDWLYLSSHGYISKGGYDIYKYKNVEGFNHILNNCKEWNSSADEIGLLYQSQSRVKVIRQDIQNTELVTFKKLSYKSRFTGKVVNEYGNMLENVVILCLNNNTFTSSDEQGNYSFRFEKYLESVDIRVLSSGYKPLNKQIIEGEQDTAILFLESAVEKTPTKVKIEQIDTTSLSFVKNELPQDYYIVLGSSYSYEEAYEFWTKWNVQFKDSEILEFANGLYRIVIKSVKSEEQALIDFAAARKKKSDIWILRPQ